MKRPSAALSLLMFFYLLLAVVAIWRTVNTHAFDLFTLGVIPVLAGLFLRTTWAGVVLKIYLAIQTVGLMALGTTAIIAYRVTPEDVKVVVNGRDIPMLWLVIAAISVMAFQYWIAFSAKTKDYLSETE